MEDLWCSRASQLSLWKTPGQELGNWIQLPYTLFWPPWAPHVCGTHKDKQAHI